MERSSLFPSAKTITSLKNEPSTASSSHVTAHDLSESNDLEMLRIDLPTSAMDAINAAQNIYTPASLDEVADIVEPRDVQSGNKSSSISSDEDSEVQKEKHVSKRKKKKRKHKHKYKKVKRHHHSESPQDRIKDSIPHVPVTAIFFDDVQGLKPEHAHRVDREKNKDLWHYKSISKRHLSKYKTLSRSILGADYLKLNKGDGDKKEKAKTFRYFGKVNARQIRCKGISLQTESKEIGVNLDFIQIPSNKSDDSQKCSSGQAVQSIPAAGSNFGDDFVMDEIFEQTRSFNQRTRDEPNDVSLWLEFVAFQDVVAQAEKLKGNGGIEVSSLSEAGRYKELYRPSRSVIEKKLAILDKALDANPSSLKLKLAQLELYQDVWESEKFEKAWEDLLFVHSGNVTLWREYLAKQQCMRGHGLTVGGVTKRFHRCFQSLIPIMEGTVKVVQKSSQMEENMISLFCQYCDFLQLSGYTEKSLASFQALIEFNLFCPSSLNLTSTADRVAKFETFWESSVPRFGEDCAHGWAKWVEGKDRGGDQYTSVHDVRTEDAEDSIILEKLPRFSTWLKVEKLREVSHLLPWRPDTSKEETEDAVEDPERLILFDDVSPVLFRLTKSESCVRLVCLFLKHLGFPSLTLQHKINLWELEPENSSKFDQYSAVTLSQYPELSRCYPSRDLDSVWTPSEVLLTLLKNSLTQAESYFSLSNRTLFTQLRLELQMLKHGTKTISEISSAGVKELKKYGKNLLKESQNRNNLVLWDTYIRVLWACSDKISETVSMIETGLAMFMGSSIGRTYGLSRLCLTYCQILLNFEPLELIKSPIKRNSPVQEDKKQAIVCLCHLLEGKKYKPGTSMECTPTYILKVRNLFEKAISECISQLSTSLQHGNSELDVVVLTDCFALFEFCASDLEAANNLYVRLRQKVKHFQEENSLSGTQCSAIYRALFLSQLSFITNVIHITLSPISIMRKVITDGLDSFPQSSQLHAAFVKLEAGANIAGRLRKYFDKMLKDSSSLIVPLFAVVSELSRVYKILTTNLTDPSAPGNHDIGIIHRLRSVFETALGLKGSQHCPLLWRLYLQFEFKNGGVDRAKGVLYRALQSCPWSKDIFKDGISMFGDAELEELMDLMTEREIRVRIPLEEIDLLCSAEKQEDSESEDSIKGEVYSYEDINQEPVD